MNDKDLTNSNKRLVELGETKIIQLIERLMKNTLRKEFLHDDAFFFDFFNNASFQEKKFPSIIFNSDMLVSTTDVPPQMNYYQIGRKSILMNISDLLVKGVLPTALFISMGVPSTLQVNDFIAMMKGIIDYCKKLNIEYIGGDLNNTREIIISPTVFGFQRSDTILYRKGIQEGDVLVANEKFGLSGVGLDILLNDRNLNTQDTGFHNSINFVLERPDLGNEGIILAENNLASASIDSSDGLSRSLRELMLSNPSLGFEINMDTELIHEEAISYSKKFNIELEDLVFNAGEEFIHLFTLKLENYLKAQKLVRKNGGNLFKIGKVIDIPKIYVFKNDRRHELKAEGYEHFREK